MEKNNSTPAITLDIGRHRIRIHRSTLSRGVPAKPLVTRAEFLRQFLQTCKKRLIFGTFSLDLNSVPVDAI